MKLLLASTINSYVGEVARIETYPKKGELKNRIYENVILNGYITSIARLSFFTSDGDPIECSPIKVELYKD